MIQTLKITGYRSIRNAEFELGPLTVLIGPNAGGKTNLIDALQLLSEAAQEKLESGILRRGGLPSLAFGGAAERIAWEIGFTDDEPFVEENGVVYRLVLAPSGNLAVVAREEVVARPGTPPGMIVVNRTRSQATFHSRVSRSNEQPEIPISGGELAIAQVRDADSYPTPHKLRGHLSSWAFYHEFDSGEDAPIRQAQLTSPGVRLLPDGANLSPVLHQMRESRAYKDTFREVIDSLTLLYPDFDGLTFPAESGQGKIILTWQDKSFKSFDFSAFFLSDGTLRLLCLLTVLLSPDPPPLICIDEPEIGLHPAAMKLIADLLQDAAARTQILVATHSPQLISYLNPDTVAVVEKQEGATVVSRLDGEALRDWLRDFSLGELFMMGRLGGRP